MPVVPGQEVNLTIDSYGHINAKKKIGARGITMNAPRTRCVDEGGSGRRTANTKQKTVGFFKKVRFNIIDLHW